MPGVLSAIRKKGGGDRMVGRHLSEIWVTSRRSEETNPVKHFGSGVAGAEGGVCPWQVQKQHCGSKVENGIERGGSRSQKPDHALHDPCRPQEAGWISFGTIGSNWQIFSKGMVWSKLCFKMLSLIIVCGDCRGTVMKTGDQSKGDTEA